MLCNTKNLDFFSAARRALAAAGRCYDQLGIKSETGYADFAWCDENNLSRSGRAVWSTWPVSPAISAIVGTPLTLNYMISDLDRILARLRQKGIALEKVTEFEHVRFVSLIDHRGQRIELWEPNH
jgi:hypothetical protein